MESYGDRPISVYDNLNITATPTSTTMQTSTPKSATATTAATPSPNGAMHSPYADISFKFNDNSNNQQQLPQLQQQQPQQQQLQQQHQHLLPNGNRSLNQSQHPTLSQVHTATTTTTPFATTNIAAPASLASPVQRPLSQHSQSELNEASQSIAAVKAALNDAKSKFFGLNGYGLNDNESHKPKVQIVVPTATPTPTPPPPPKPQPTYQNIPFRNQPPELPPKPNDLQRFNSTDAAAATPSPASSSPQSGRISAEPSMSDTPKMSSSSNSPAAPPAASQVRVIPLTNYKQLLLNDVDTSQPSQAVYMSTTVPQNIKGTKIAGRHTPTRNSLRHSRMLVVNNKNYQGVQHPNPMNFKYPNLARWILILAIIIGLLISFLSIWIQFLAATTKTQDKPYWSGVPLLLAGMLGLVLVRYQRIKRHKVRENCFIFLRADSYLLSLVALLLCCVALIFATINYVRLTAADTSCVSTNKLLPDHGSCMCTFNAVAPINATDYNGSALPAAEVENYVDNSFTEHFCDLTCSEVQGVWTCILGISITLHTMGFLVSLIYIILLACYRHNSKRFYASVHTSTF